jgi:hypothetical protein
MKRDRATGAPDFYRFARDYLHTVARQWNSTFPSVLATPSEPSRRASNASVPVVLFLLRSRVVGGARIGPPPR